jgi:hypothetical protein
MGKANHRKRSRRATARESPESRIFREYLRREESAEMPTDVAGAIRAAGYDPDELDIPALARISRLAGVVQSGGEILLVIEPARPFDDHMEFDRVICAAGVKAFVRRTMESDQPGSGTPLDPSVPVPDYRFPEHLVVREATPGMRHKSGIELEGPSP